MIDKRPYGDTTGDMRSTGPGWKLLAIMLLIGIVFMGVGVVAYVSLKADVQMLKEDRDEAQSARLNILQELRGIKNQVDVLGQRLEPLLGNKTDARTPPIVPPSQR